MPRKENGEVGETYKLSQVIQLADCCMTCSKPKSQVAGSAVVIECLYTKSLTTIYGFCRLHERDSLSVPHFYKLLSRYDGQQRVKHRPGGRGATGPDQQSANDSGSPGDIK